MKYIFLLLNLLILTISLQAAEISLKEKEALAQSAELKSAEVKAQASLTPLMEAIEKGDQDELDALLESGTDVKINAQNLHGDTALHMSIAKGNDVTTKKLLEVKGININIENNDGFTPIALAINEGNADIVAALIKMGADLNTRSFKGKKKIIAELEEIVKKSNLLADRVKLWQAQYVNGMTPLMLAVRKGDPAIVKLLLDAGANPTVNMLKDNKYVNAFDMIPKGNKEIAQMLEAKKKEFSDRAKEFIEYGILIRPGGYIQFSNPKRSDYLNKIINIFAQGIDINYKKNETPLYIATAIGLNDIVRQLIYLGADLEARNNSGETALFIAASHGKKDLVEMLINAGADVNAGTAMGRDLWNGLPLDNVIIQQLKDVAKILMKAGAKHTLNAEELIRYGWDFD